MELKFNIFSNVLRSGTGSNRTFMELKSWRVVFLLGRELGSNRTFMELKYG